MIRLKFNEYEIELVNESPYIMGSADNSSNYNFVYRDQNSEFKQTTNHGIKVFEAERLFSSALISGSGGATGIHKTSAIIVDEDILICCSDMIFSLTLPDLKLNWKKIVDDATCFQIFKTDHGIFVHGEMQASRIDKGGDILWTHGFAEILVTLDGTACFTIQDNCIDIVDWDYRKYKVSFDGKYI